MTDQHKATPAATPMTRKLAAFIANTDGASIPKEIFDHAKVAFMDWVAVTLGGKDDPLVDKLIAWADMMGGNSQATLLGRDRKVSMSQASLINGSASHALDYDDTLVSFLGCCSSFWYEYKVNVLITCVRPRDLISLRLI